MKACHLCGEAKPLADFYRNTKGAGIAMKACHLCGEAKPLADFYRNTKGGYMGRCKGCVKARVRQYRLDNLDRVREYDRSRSDLEHRVAIRKRVAVQRRADPDLRTRDREVKNAWSSRNREKKQAHKIVKRAIDSGTLSVMPCERCGYGVGVHAHHEDYSRPLDVTWLCRRCHGERHREINEERRKAAAI